MIIYLRQILYSEASGNFDKVTRGGPEVSACAGHFGGVHAAILEAQHTEEMMLLDRGAAAVLYNLLLLSNALQVGGLQRQPHSRQSEHGAGARAGRGESATCPEARAFFKVGLPFLTSHDKDSAAFHMLCRAAHAVRQYL